MKTKILRFKIMYQAMNDTANPILLNFKIKIKILNPSADA
jgi:hypothetical protein